MSVLTNAVYLLAAALFIFGLKLLSHPRTARRGNLLAMIGMLLAIIMTLLDKQIVDFTFIIAGLVCSTASAAPHLRWSLMRNTCFSPAPPRWM